MTDLTADRGDEQRYELTLVDADGAPLSLEDAEIWFTVKRHYRDADSDALFQKTVGDGIELGDDVGAAIITLSPEDTEDAPEYLARYIYDIQVRTVDGVIETPLKGTFLVRPDVTLGELSS